MRRVLATVLLLLTLLAPVARGGEPALPPGIDPARVGRLLLSRDEEQRTLGARLLLERVSRGGDVAAFLAEMARAQAEWAHAETRLVERYTDLLRTGTPTERLHAARVLAALRSRTVVPPRPAGPVRTPPSRSAPTLGTPSSEVPAAPPVPTLPTARTLPAPAAAESIPAESIPAESVPAKDEREARLVRLAWTLLEVPESEVAAWLGDAPGDAAKLGPVLAGQPVVLGEDGRRLFQRASVLPEGRAGRFAPEATVAVGRDVPLVPGVPLRYRKSVKRAGKAGWGVDGASLDTGLTVSARVEEAAAGEPAPFVLHLVVRHTDVPLPMGTERVRPAKNVEPLEIDRPEWRTATSTVSAPMALGGSRIVAFVPAVVPGRVVVVGVSLSPLPAAVRASRQTK